MKIIYYAIITAITAAYTFALLHFWELIQRLPTFAQYALVAIALVAFISILFSYLEFDISKEKKGKL